MSILHALFGGPGGRLQAPEMAGNMNFGQRLMSGSPLNRMMNGRFPNAPGSQGNTAQGRMSGALSMLNALSPAPVAPMQLAPMAMQSQQMPDLNAQLQQWMSMQTGGRR